MLPGELWFYFGVAWLITLRVPSPSFLLIPDPVSVKGGGWQVNSCNSPKEATESPKTEKHLVEACLMLQGKSWNAWNCRLTPVAHYKVGIYPSCCLKGELTTFGTVAYMNT